MTKNIKEESFNKENDDGCVFGGFFLIEKSRKPRIICCHLEVSYENLKICPR